VAVSHSNGVDTIPLAGNHATVQNKDLKIYYLERTVTSPLTAHPTHQVARRWTSQTVAPFCGSPRPAAQPRRHHSSAGSARPRVPVTHITLAEHR
jgi:hypothetical protein